MATNFETAPVKDTCALFSPTSLFSGPCYLMVSFEFLPWGPLLPWQRIFGTKIDYNLAPVKDKCAPFAPTLLFLGPGYPMVSFKFFACRPLLPWQRILGQNWLQLGPVKDNCAVFAPTPLYTPARLYNMAMGQIPHSTDRIFSIDIKCCCLQSATGVYLAALPPPPVPQILCKVCWHFFYSSILFIRLPGSIVREGLMFCNSFYYYFFNARSPRSVGWLPRNFATWRKACSIL